MCEKVFIQACVFFSLSTHSDVTMSTQNISLCVKSANTLPEPTTTCWPTPSTGHFILIPFIHSLAFIIRMQDGHSGNGSAQMQCAHLVPRRHVDAWALWASSRPLFLSRCTAVGALRYVSWHQCTGFVFLMSHSLTSAGCTWVGKLGIHRHLNNQSVTHTHAPGTTHD